MGCIAFSPLAQGVLTNKYLNGIPVDSRAASHRGNGAIEENVITPQLIQKLNALNAIAGKRNQSLAQMALAWVLKDKRITSVLIGVSKAEQLTDSLMALNNYTFHRKNYKILHPFCLHKNNSQP